MTRDDLLAELRECGTEWTQTEDPAEDRLVFQGKYAGGLYNEQGHRKADSLLLAYINDPEVTAAYEDLARFFEYSY